MRLGVSENGAYLKMDTRKHRKDREPWDFRVLGFSVQPIQPSCTE